MLYENFLKNGPPKPIETNFNYSKEPREISECPVFEEKCDPIHAAETWMNRKPTWVGGGKGPHETGHENWMKRIEATRTRRRARPSPCAAPRLVASWSPRLRSHSHLCLAFLFLFLLTSSVFYGAVTRARVRW